MDVDAFLRFHRVAYADLIGQIRARVQHDPADLLLLAGSLCEGLGNHRSDLDVYRVPSQHDEAPAGDPVSILDFGTFALDVETVERTALERLLARLDAVDSDADADPRKAVADFSDADVKLLHQLRIAHTVPGGEPFRQLAGAVHARKLARVLLDRAVAWMGALHIDILGFVEIGDDESARPLLRAFRARLGAALLAGLGETNPAEKWQIRLLARLATPRAALCLPGGDALATVIDRWRALDHRIGEWSAEQALRALARLRFAIVPWAQQRFLSGVSLQSNDNGFPAVAAQHRSDGTVLPPLRLDCQLQRDARGIWISRVASPEVIYVNPLAHEVLMLFDGASTAGAAVQRITQLSTAAATDIERAVDDFRTVLADRAYI
jgi:hypothetical protein